MRKFMYNRALFILHLKRQPPHFHDFKVKEVFESHFKENHFLV